MYGSPFCWHIKLCSTLGLLLQHSDRTRHSPWTILPPLLNSNITLMFQESGKHYGPFPVALPQLCFFSNPFSSILFSLPLPSSSLSLYQPPFSFSRALGPFSPCCLLLVKLNLAIPIFTLSPLLPLSPTKSFSLAHVHATLLPPPSSLLMLLSFGETTHTD